jgi:hypothetical protein
LLVAALALILSASGLASASATLPPVPKTTVLTHDVLPGRATATVLGYPSPNAVRTIEVSLASSDQSGLDALASAQHDPKSAQYKHFLTPAQFAARFGAPSTATSALSAWLRAGGLNVAGISTSGRLVTATGTVAQIEKRFATKLAVYSYGGKPIVANTVAPTVPAGLGITSVNGLIDLGLRTASSGVPDSPVSTVVGPSDLWRIYEQPPADTGQGETISLFGWGDPKGVESDLRGFERANGLPAVPFTAKIVGTPGAYDALGQEEWDLDTQASTGMAPGVEGVTFYFVTSGDLTLMAGAVQQWADDAAGSKQASGSFGLCEAFSSLGLFLPFDAALQQAFVEGRTFFASSGDNGSGCSAAVNTNGITIGPVPSQEYPASSAWVTAVGGTSLYTTGSPPERAQELAWDYGGGGPSYFQTRPDWQTTTVPATWCAGDQTFLQGNLPDTSGTGKPCRAVVDVSAVSAGELGAAGSIVGDGGYSVMYQGAMTSVGGTSLSSPLWAGMWARVSAAATTATGPAAPLTYAIGQDAAAYARDFNDILAGSNGLYAATPGWDYPTGWGTPRVTGLIKDVTGATSIVPTHPGAVYDPPSDDTTVAPPCPTRPAHTMTDPTGDATQLAIADTGAAPINDAAADITAADLEWANGAAGPTITATISVAALSAHPGTGSVGENYRFDFSYNGVPYEIQASYGASPSTSNPGALSLDATDFSWGVVGTTGVTSLSSLEGSVDVASNTITVLLPASTFSSLQPDQPAFGSGPAIGSLQVLAQRLDGFLTLTADDAAPATDCAVALS